MFFLSPEKLMVILVVALVVLGPDKLPQVAKQIGQLWGDFRRFRHRLESDVRGSFPELPSVDTISHAVRSPLSFLDKLADSHEADQSAETTSATLDDPTADTNEGQVDTPPEVGQDPEGEPASDGGHSPVAVQPDDGVPSAGGSTTAGASRSPVVAPAPVADHRVRPAAAGTSVDPGMN